MLEVEMDSMESNISSDGKCFDLFCEFEDDETLLEHYGLHAIKETSGIICLICRKFFVDEIAAGEHASNLLHYQQYCNIMLNENTLDCKDAYSGKDSSENKNSLEEECYDVHTFSDELEEGKMNEALTTVHECSGIVCSVCFKFFISEASAARHAKSWKHYQKCYPEAKDNEIDFESMRELENTASQKKTSSHEESKKQVLDDNDSRANTVIDWDTQNLEVNGSDLDEQRNTQIITKNEPKCLTDMSDPGHSEKDVPDGSSNTLSSAMDCDIEDTEMNGSDLEIERNTQIIEKKFKFLTNMSDNIESQMDVLGTSNSNVSTATDCDKQDLQVNGSYLEIKRNSQFVEKDDPKFVTNAFDVVHSQEDMLNNTVNKVIDRDAQDVEMEDNKWDPLMKLDNDWWCDFDKNLATLLKDIQEECGES